LNFQGISRFGVGVIEGRQVERFEVGGYIGVCAAEDGLGAGKTHVVGEAFGAEDEVPTAGSAEPIPELVKHLFVVTRPDDGEAGLTELEAGGAVIAAAEPLDGPGHLGECVDGIGEGLVRLSVPLTNGDGKPGGDDGSKMVAGRALQLLGDFAGVGGKDVGVKQSLLLGEPFDVAALPPFGKVLIADGPAFKKLGEDLSDFGKGVEPIEDGSAGLAIEQTAIHEVECFAREMGNFSDPSPTRIDQAEC